MADGRKRSARNSTETEQRSLIKRFSRLVSGQSPDRLIEPPRVPVPVPPERPPAMKSRAPKSERERSLGEEVTNRMYFGQFNEVLKRRGPI